MNELKTDLREEPQSIATRKASEICLKYINDATTITLGGSADLTGSNNTKTDNINPVTAEAYGRYIHYGIREHAMGAIMNGVSLGMVDLFHMEELFLFSLIIAALLYD